MACQEPDAQGLQWLRRNLRYLEPDTPCDLWPNGTSPPRHRSGKPDLWSAAASETPAELERLCKGWNLAWFLFLLDERLHNDNEWRELMRQRTSLKGRVRDLWHRTGHSPEGASLSRGKPLRIAIAAGWSAKGTAVVAAVVAFEGGKILAMAIEYEAYGGMPGPG